MCRIAGDEPPPPGMETTKEGLEAGEVEEGKGEGEEKEKDTKEAEEDAEPKPRNLHQTSSIFLRNLAPTITKQEVDAVS